jgi:pilus assembly protein Flp/PilA
VDFFRSQFTLCLYVSAKPSNKQGAKSVQDSFALLNEEEDSNMKKLLNKIRKNESGATAIEYGLIAALIAVVLITSLGLLGNNISSKFNTIASSVAAR